MSKARKSCDVDSGGDDSDDKANGEHHDVADDDTEWQTDMSADAVARRHRAQLTAAAASLVQCPEVRHPLRARLCPVFCLWSVQTCDSLAKGFPVWEGWLVVESCIFRHPKWNNAGVSAVSGRPYLIWWFCVPLLGTQRKLHMLHVV
jgi:hypothetical protein